MCKDVINNIKKHRLILSISFLIILVLLFFVITIFHHKNILLDIIFLLVIFFLYLSMTIIIIPKEGGIHKRKLNIMIRSIVTASIIFVLIVLWYNVFIEYAYVNEKLNLNYSTYEFDIEFDENGKNINLNNLLYQYNFNNGTNGNGSIHFKIREKDKSIKTNQFIIRLPEGLDITDLNLKKESEIFKDNINYKKYISKPCENKSNDISFDTHIHCDTHVAVTEFNMPLNEDDVDVNISGQLIPNGEFRFYIYSSRASPSGIETNTVIKLDMGDYELRYPIQINKYSKYEMNNKILRIKPSDEYIEEKLQGPFQPFINVNTYNKVLSDKKDRYEAFYISLLVAIIVFCAELFIEFVFLISVYIK